MSWPADWDARVCGTACPMCSEGRPARTEHGVRVFAGEYLDAYVSYRAAQRGYIVAIWSGRHVVDLSELLPEELAGFWAEVVRVASAMRVLYRPRKINYEVLGNQLPHLHVHLTARYESSDVAPGGPSPADRSALMPGDEVEADAITLARILDQESAT